MSSKEGVARGDVTSKGCASTYYMSWSRADAFVPGPVYLRCATSRFPSQTSTTTFARHRLFNSALEATSCSSDGSAFAMFSSQIITSDFFVAPATPHQFAAPPSQFSESRFPRGMSVLGPPSRLVTATCRSRACIRTSLTEPHFGSVADFRRRLARWPSLAGGTMFRNLTLRRFLVSF